MKYFSILKYVKIIIGYNWLYKIYKLYSREKMKKAFTMIELVFVIVVIGILAAVIIPNTRTNPAQEGAIDLLSKIKYTQHLAMVDDKYDASNNTWYKNRWQIKLDATNNQYSIVSNVTFAQDTLNSDKNISNIDLSAKYGVTMTVNGTECSVNNGGVHGIGFDSLGRPIAGDLNTLTSPYVGTNVDLVKTADCAIVLTNGSETATINISPETGYATITF